MQKVKVGGHLVQKIEWKQTDGQTDEWEPNALLSSLMQSVITVDFCQFSTDNSLLLLAIVISF